MSENYSLEWWSWVAGIGVALGALLQAILAARKEKKSPEASQRAGSNSTQIAHNSGTIIFGRNPDDHEAVDSEGKWDLEGKWDKDQAMKMATSRLEAFDWGSIFSENFGTPPYHHEPLSQYDLVYKDRQAIVLALRTKPSDYECHACAPYLSFFEFEKHGRGWNLIGCEIGVVEMGSFGYFSEDDMSIEVIGENLYGVLLKSSYTSQGQMVWGVTIFARIGDSFREILDLAMGELGPMEFASEEIKVSDVGWSSTLHTRPTSVGLYDIVVERRGENGPQDLKYVNGADMRQANVADHDGNVRPSDIFRFDGRRYKRSSTFK